MYEGMGENLPEMKITMAERMEFKSGDDADL
jgi:hypothetical protein